MQRSFPSSWGILVNTCPGLGTPAPPLDLALSVQQILPSAELTASASTTTKDFGADFRIPTAKVRDCKRNLCIVKIADNEDQM